MVKLESLEPTSLIGAPQLRFGPLGEREVVAGVPAPQRVSVTALAELLERELLDRLEHEEAAVFRLSKQALVYKGLQHVEIGVANRFDRLEVEAADKDGEARE